MAQSNTQESVAVGTGVIADVGTVVASSIASTGGASAIAFEVKSTADTPCIVVSLPPTIGYIKQLSVQPVSTTFGVTTFTVTIKDSRTGNNWEIPNVPVTGDTALILPSNLFLTGEGATLEVNSLGANERIIKVGMMGDKEMPEPPSTAILDGDFTGDGILTRTAVGIYTAREIIAGKGLAVTNGDGVSGNPTLNLEKTSRGIIFDDPTNSEDRIFAYTPVAITISRIYGETDTGTCTFKVYWRAEGSAFAEGTAVHGTGLVADATGEEQSSGFADATIPANSFLVWVTSAVASTPTKVGIIIDFIPD